MEHFESYEIEKKKLVEKIIVAKENLLKMKELDLDVSESLEKLEQTVASLDKDLISIVLIGSFSDGKTSVIAGWLGEKTSNMKIDSQESSDQLEIYHPVSIPDKCEIVDTPGLFGTKEKENEKGEVVKLSEITKKYVDQANIILYVVEAKNPIKDSHKDVVKWIMNDLHKIETTIFVINKMDGVSDLTDDEDFNKVKKIKTSTLKEKVAEIAELSESEVDKIKVVCISSNPDEKDFDFWKENRSVYEERSRILTLEDATNEILRNNSSTSLISKTGYDVLENVITKNIEFLDLQLDLLSKEVIPELEESFRRNKKDYEKTRASILKQRPRYLKDLRKYEKQLLTELRSVTFENINEFVVDEIGIEDNQPGYRLQQGITLIAQEYFDEATAQIAELQDSIERQEAKQNEVLDAAIKNAEKVASGAFKAAGKIPVGQMKNAILAGRDILKKVFKIQIKFKPYGVVKLANGIIKGLPIIGVILDIGFEIFDIIKRNQEKNRFEKMKADIQELITQVFKQITDDTNDNELFLKTMAPQLEGIEEYLRNQEDIINEQIKRREKFEQLKKDAILVDSVRNN